VSAVESLGDEEGGRESKEVGEGGEGEWRVRKEEGGGGWRVEGGGWRVEEGGGWRTGRPDIQLHPSLTEDEQERRNKRG
jgi:hypothetical protein